MQDVSGGKERVRAWPRKRGKRASPEQKANREKFRNAQTAAKWMSPQQAYDFRAAVSGTPLLPRDLVTSMMYGRLCAFIMPDGKVLYPMAARNDVSDALDMITQTPGQSLIRGQDTWEPYTPGGGGAGGWTVIHDETITSPIPNITVNNVGTFSAFMATIYGVTTSVSGIRNLVLSSDNGATWLNTNSDYLLVENNGSTSAWYGFTFNTANSSAARYGANLLIGNLPGMIVSGIRLAGDGVLRIPTTALGVFNALRLENSTGGNLTGGRFILMGQ